jgi:hypothetical protein
MQLEALRQIEASLGLRLPPYYKDFINHYPERLLAIPNGPAESWLLDDAESVIRCNRDVRSDEFESHEFEWPDSHFVIGLDEGGNYFTLDRTAAESPVYLFDFHWRTFDRFCASLDKYAAYLSGDAPLDQCR